MALFKKESGYKTSWYDGWFFAAVPDRNLEKKLHHNSITIKLIPPGTTVLDIGCGPGGLVRSLSEKCKAVKGVDVSPRMIRYARKHNSAQNVEFILVKRNEKLSGLFTSQFDHIVIKLALHEMPEPERANLIDEAKKISSDMIIVDWLAPQPKNFTGIRTFMIEMFSTPDHFRNFRQWHAAGGIDGFLERHGLRIIHEELFKNKTGKVVRVSC